MSASCCLWRIDAETRLEFATADADHTGTASWVVVTILSMRVGERMQRAARGNQRDRLAGNRKAGSIYHSAGGGRGRRRQREHEGIVDGVPVDLQADGTLVPIG